MKKTKVADLRYRARYELASLINRLPGQCWADLVMWVQGSKSGNYRWPWSTSQSICREDMRRTGCCYCGKLQDPAKLAEQDAKAANL